RRRPPPRARCRRRRRPRSRTDPDLHVPEPPGSGAVRDVRALPELALPAVRQPVQAPFVGAGDRVERAPETRRDARVARVPEHPPEPTVLAPSPKLRPEL